MLVRRFVFGLSLALAAAPQLIAQVGFPLFSTDFPPEEFAKLTHAKICGSTIPKIGAK